MSRRRKKQPDLLTEIHNLLVVAPWWVGLVVMAATWGLVAKLIPAVLRRGVRTSGSPGGVQLPTGPMDGVASAIAGVAPIAVLVVGIVWVGALLTKRQNSRRLDQQASRDTIRDLPWREFELLLAEAFRRQGHAVEDTGPGPDGGVDLVLHRGGLKELVQCKQWRTRRVGVDKVRELLGVVHAERADGGVFVTSGGYSAAATRFAEDNGIRLIDGESLQRLIHGVQRGTPAMGLPAPAAARPREGDCTSTASLLCPRCKSLMVQRKARRGPNAGGTFLGCSTYPRCKGTRQISATG